MAIHVLYEDSHKSGQRKMRLCVAFSAKGCTINRSAEVTTIVLMVKEVYAPRGQSVTRIEQATLMFYV